MKRILVIVAMFSFVLASCSQPSQTWAPKSGKKMKKGYNHR
ncbi:MAG: hypothetical protein ACK4ND_03905 [Cytophagaceae bacterium]